ncbi:TetR/AcrR family transcriptional regulator [Nocardia seriolae]|nr:TetR family transcriptional regulator [Nocardia seriolae]MTJ75673.1 TetR family transcriptional regulator [Nocardia seriolae]MTJ87450.1 TetR family transcriptional regulator [Nocardia seriolae]MTK31441.1 TetR family transcriptional regulator [Nocardia seriolae]MTK40502.1 TetR family transcriptional regulator [Nocardia seriolae]
MTATERSAEVLAAATTAFAESGYAATKTDDIARRAGVSQPYVIRLFGTKQQLFLAVLDQVCGRIDELFRAGATTAEPDADPKDRLDCLGGYFGEHFLTDPDLPRVFLQGIAAASEPAIGANIRAHFGQLYNLAKELTGATASEVRRFFATGMLLIDLTALGFTVVDCDTPPWATEILTTLGEDGI